jgi:hypothetical protein
VQVVVVEVDALGQAHPQEREALGVRQSPESYWQEFQRTRSKSSSSYGRADRVLRPEPMPAPPLVGVRYGCESAAYRYAW